MLLGHVTEKVMRQKRGRNLTVAINKRKLSLVRIKQLWFIIKILSSMQQGVSPRWKYIVTVGRTQLRMCWNMWCHMSCSRLKGAEFMLYLSVWICWLAICCPLFCIIDHSFTQTAADQPDPCLFCLWLFDMCLNILDLDKHCKCGLDPVVLHSPECLSNLKWSGTTSEYFDIPAHVLCT